RMFARNHARAAIERGAHLRFPRDGEGTKAGRPGERGRSIYHIDDTRSAARVDDRPAYDSECESSPRSATKSFHALRRRVRGNAQTPACSNPLTRLLLGGLPD